MLNYCIKSNNSAFSLVEILIALIVVSLTAVNITAMQNKVLQQQHDNIARAAMVSLITDKMEQLLSLVDVAQLSAMDEVSETNLQMANTDFSVLWSVSDVASVNHGGDFKQVVMDVSWLDVQGTSRDFSHSQQVNLALFTPPSLHPSLVSTFPAATHSLLAFNELIYFQPKLKYQQGAFVIHDSYLYQATADYDIEHGYPHLIVDPDNGDTNVSEGWLGFGLIDDPSLANHEQLSTLLAE